jgi:cysteine desulfurase family protein (TIGR01976 family)
MALDPTVIRSNFPALASGAIFLDNPGGTQVAQQTLDAMLDYLVNTNANHGGAFATSLASDELIHDARMAVADFLNAPSPEGIIFGPNMTTLTFNLSRSLALELNSGDEIVVTHLDHDANITPWTLIAEQCGCQVHWLDIDVEDCTLRLDQLHRLLNERTKLVAVGYASNAVGTINPVAEIISAAHQVGALCFVDAVQYAPHGPIDVQALDCDFLVVSAYKVFGPHVGALYGKRSLLERLRAYKVRPAPIEPPGKFETGTQNHEGIAGIFGALKYLTDLGKRFGGEYVGHYSENFEGRRLLLKQAMAAIRDYEMKLSHVLIDTLSKIPSLTIWGITSERDLDRRVPTVSFTMEGLHPRDIAEALGAVGIYVWDGNYYALAVTERLGVEKRGGMVRVGLTHYNTLEEVERLGEALQKLGA